VTRRSIAALALSAALLISAPAAWAAIRITTASRGVVSQTGTLRFWDMTKGTAVQWDTTAQWNTGTSTSTSASATAGTLTLKPSGSTGSTSRTWWNLSWSTRRCFTVAGTGVALTAQPVSLTFDSATDIANGWLQASGADLRAIADDNVTQLSLLLIGPINTAATVVSVLANIPATGTTICLYSGNAPAASVSSSAPFSTTRKVDTGATVAPAGWLNDAATAAWRNDSITASTVVTTANAVTVQASAVGTPAAVFQNARVWDANTITGPLTYTIPNFAPGATVSLTAYFAEDAAWSNNRRFDVVINAVTTPPAESSFNIRGIAGGGGYNQGIGRTYSATASAAGTVTLSLAKTPALGSGLDPEPLISGFLVTGPTTAIVAGVAAPNEGLYPITGTWDSPVIDSGAGTAIYGSLIGDPLAGTSAGATYQIAASNSATGPWTYLGPGGTAATVFTGGQEATPTSIDGLRYSRVRVTLSTPSRLTTPSIGRVMLRAALPILARPAGERSSQTASPQPMVLRNDGTWVATQSSVAFGGSPGKAIDGIVDGVYYGSNSVQHSGYASGAAGPPESNPWWQVDLGRSQMVGSVKLWNRTDCCDTRGTNMTVYVSDVPFSSPISATPGVTSVNHPGTVGRATELTFNRNARYVRVQLNATEWMHLAEVEVVSPVALLTKITGFESGLVALSDSLIHETATGSPLTTNVRLGASHQIRLASGTVTLAGTPVVHSTSAMIISATGQLSGPGLTATHNFTFRGIWTGEQLRIERPMSVVWSS
jgi:F5/8 type C domain